MATTVDSDVPETGAVFTFGRSKFADNLPNKFWVKNDRVVQIACGDEHTALIAESGRVFMFGPNEWGQLGLGNDSKGVNKPSCVKSLKHEKSKYVACGRSHTIVSTEAGHIYSFGSHADGQLGYKTTTDQHVPKRIESLPSTKYKMLAAGSDSSVALTDDGTVFMWGNNEDGKLGLGEVEIVDEPTQLPMDRPVVCVACGYYHTAIVTDDGKLFTMGESDGGKLGLTDAADETNIPQHVTAIPEPVRWVSCGSSHTVAITEKGNCYVFGEGESGQLGLGTDISSVTAPTLLKLPFKAIKAYCGQAFTALISEKGQLYTFGDGRHGKLAHGDDQFSNQFRPYHCKRFSHFVVTKVACGGCHMIVTAKPKLHDDGDVSIDCEMDEMKTLDDKTLLHTLDGGSPTLSRSLSAREKRRNEVTRSFSTLTDLLPALNRTRLSTTMPALKSSHAKVNGEILSKTVTSMLAVQNGVSSEKDSDDEDKQKKVIVNKEHTPVASPRSKSENTTQAPGHAEDGSEGDDEQDDSSAQEEGSEKGEKLSEEVDEDLMALTNELEKKITDNDSDNEKLADRSGPKSLAKVNSTELHNGGIHREEVDEMEEKKEEVKSSHSAPGETHVDANHTRKMPLPTPRKKTDTKEKAKESEGEDDEEEEEDDEEEDEEDEEEDVNKKKEAEKKEKGKKNKEKGKDKDDQLKDKKNTKKNKEDKKKNKDKENKEEENGEEEKKDKKKGKNKQDKSKEDSKSKKGKEKVEDETEEKESKKDKKKPKDADKSNKSKKKGKKEEENEEEEDKDENEQNDKKKDKNKKKEKEEPEVNKKKKGEKGKGDEEIAAEEKTTASEKDENGNKKPPAKAKKSRLCSIL